MSSVVASWLHTWADRGDRPALIWRDRPFSYAWLAAEIQRWAADPRIAPGAVVGLAAEYSPRAVAILLASLSRGAIVAPVTPAFAREREAFFEVAQAELRIDIGQNDEVSLTDTGTRADHALLQELRARANGGLILFSSGATGRSKAVVHDASPLLERYRKPRRSAVTIAFMLFDHVGGIHTTLHTLSSGGTLVLLADRRPQTVLQTVARHRVRVLPTTPTFINLMLLADLSAYDLRSLAYLTYSAERMPASALERVAQALPGVEVVQNYGLSEVGVLRAQSEDSRSLWVKLGGDGYQTRVRDGLLEIKAKTAMLGYLNEESPFTDDGWLRTGDRVEVRGDFFRILGRASDIIMIGGEKVYPAEVEDAILKIDGVIDVVVRGEAHALTGELVCAEVHLQWPETRFEFRRRMHKALASELADYKIPQKVQVSREPLQGARWKKTRHA